MRYRGDDLDGVDRQTTFFLRFNHLLFRHVHIQLGSGVFLGGGNTEEQEMLPVTGEAGVPSCTANHSDTSLLEVRKLCEHHLALLLRSHSAGLNIVIHLSILISIKLCIG